MNKHKKRGLVNLGTVGLAGLLAGSPATAEEEVGIKFSTKGGLKMETTDGNFTFQVGGRVQVDGAYYDDDVRDLGGSGTELRRARLSAEGTLFKVWNYKGEYDFADNEISIKDAYIQYDGFKPTTLRIGNFKEYFSLELLTSARFITFMERALPVDAFAPDRRIGLGVHTYGDFWSAAGGIFAQDPGGVAFPNGNDGIGGSDSYAFAGRATFAPLHSETELAHLGAAVEYRTSPKDEEVRFRTRPESHFTGVRLVDTDFIEGVDNTVKWGLEAAGVYGPWSVQGEYIFTRVDRKNGFENLDFDGWYVYGSWFLTGESRPYKLSSGAFDRVKPKSEYGAWEVAVRYSTIDLNDGPIRGGDEDNVTVGLNWYANPYIRFMVNYIKVYSSQFDSALGRNIDDEPNILQLRAQVDF
jgi:Phosphate-selective porin